MERCVSRQPNGLSYVSIDISLIHIRLAFATFSDIGAAVKNIDSQMFAGAVKLSRFDKAMKVFNFCAVVAVTCFAFLKLRPRKISIETWENHSAAC